MCNENIFCFAYFITQFSFFSPSVSHKANYFVLFSVHLFKLKTYHEVVDEIYYQVKHLEPWERGSRKTAGQTGMCGGVSMLFNNYYNLCVFMLESCIQQVQNF